jgi:N-methylhydantoinase B/oxoprolinase/acetone carboxylase alpha subunit
MKKNKTNTIDPVRYEMFLHRLWAIGEEGRMTLQRVTASPIVSQGGECMSSFYDEKGTMVLACSGHLRFAAATSDAIGSLMQRFSEAYVASELISPIFGPSGVSIGHILP